MAVAAQLPSLRKPAVGSTLRYPDNASTSADVLLIAGGKGQIGSDVAQPIDEDRRPTVAPAATDLRSLMTEAKVEGRPSR